ncbi:MAG TPA: HEAT repeat domain-containing protein [Planctomycetota bacterium]|nr:HEAT repeat domain-containing protein [Planctomycetota bacterium]
MARTLPSLLAVVLVVGPAKGGSSALGPYDRQVAAHTAKLRAESPSARAKAAEALGFLRAYAAGAALVARLRDEAPEVRRQAAMALAWCGGRTALPPLLATLDDADWVTRQAAHVALTNLTGMEFPFDAFASKETRRTQATAWREWWAAVPTGQPPAEVLKLLGDVKVSAGATRPPEGGTTNGLARGAVTVSSTYKGPPESLRDGQLGPGFWQTKLVPFPQWVVVDLGQPRKVGRVAVHQHGPTFVMTDCELATGLDGKAYDTVVRRREATPVKWETKFPAREVRYVRVTSHASKNPTYPTTFLEIEVDGDPPPTPSAPSPVTGHASRVMSESAWRFERGLRALGVLGGKGASRTILSALGPSPSTALHMQPAVRAGIRSLGRLREEEGFQALVALLGNLTYARNAAEALGDFGDSRAVPALLAAYPRYAKTLKGQNPSALPPDDRMGFPSEDRMLETPYGIAYALCRLGGDGRGGPFDFAQGAKLRELAPLFMANLPGDHDTFFLYEPEVGHLLTRHLVDQAGLRREALEHAFAILSGTPTAGAGTWPTFPPIRVATWLPCLCAEKADVPRLLALLEHKEYWVRLNAAKALAWLGDRSAVEPLAKLLAEAKPEAEFGYSGRFKDEEYNDTCPRWREGLVRALGLLGAHEHTGLIVQVLEDEQSVVDVRHAAASALADLGDDKALAALRRAAADHPFHVVRLAARDALLRHEGRASWPVTDYGLRITDSTTRTATTTSTKQDDVPALVFIKGDNDLPNTRGTVEQLDRWRTTYIVSDPGPEYRPGDNLYVLRPPGPEGAVAPLTRFTKGYVASPELSWDASHVLFSHRGKSDPWWHVWRVNVDGSGLKQLTFGPFHDVQPAYLADGRIVFSTSRNGIRDEYHGYPCTALWVMNPDGTGMYPIATNIGRDNEPAVLHDGRIVFSRLEVFYSRNKTELTLHAAYPDGTRDVVLYGPERRAFWRGLDHGPRTPADGQEAPLTHRVLRVTQPQPMPDGRHIVVSTQGGLTLVGPRRDAEEIITPDNKTRAYTTPWPLPDGRILCASTLKTPDRKKVDLGLYVLDPATQKLELVYNDPAAADYEPRPILARRPPAMRSTQASPDGYSGRFLCSSVFATQEAEVLQRGRLVRLIEGVPVVARHTTHTSRRWPVWQNHGGTLARVLGTAPLAPDGSFHVEAPADRLLHFQVLDSDRRVVGNQLTWMSPRPGETRSCVGCHENPHTTTAVHAPMAATHPPLSFLPTGDEFRYRAKAWFKGHLPAAIEERTRTVRAVNLLAR